MTLAPDLLAKQVITNTLAILPMRDDLVDQIFEGFDPSITGEIKEYLAGAKIDVRLGWTQQSTKMPVVAISIPGEQESAQYIGSEPGAQFDADLDGWYPSAYVDPDTGNFIEAQIAQFTGACDAAIYALNATEATWIAAIIKWTLLRNRRVLEVAGMFEQRISMTDFIPASDYPQPDTAYTRVVKLAYSTLVNYTFDDDEPESTAVAHSIVVENLSE